jgi:hypothetical protein
MPSLLLCRYPFSVVGLWRKDTEEWSGRLVTSCDIIIGEQILSKNQCFLPLLLLFLGHRMFIYDLISPFNTKFHNRHLSIVLICTYLTSHIFYACFLRQIDCGDFHLLSVQALSLSSTRQTGVAVTRYPVQIFGDLRTILANAISPGDYWGNTLN